MQLEKLQDQKPECHLEWPNSNTLVPTPTSSTQEEACEKGYYSTSK